MLNCRKVLEELAGAPLDGWEAFSGRVRTLRFRAGRTVFAGGETAPDLLFLCSGLIKLTYLREDGSEWIKSFIQEGMFFSSVTAIMTKAASPFSAVALEDCVVERLPVEPLMQLADHDLGWSRALRNGVIDFAMRKEERERLFLTMTAQERYRHLLMHAPEIVGRVAQKDLAAYLGVTPVGLSRIARRIRVDA